MSTHVRSSISTEQYFNPLHKEMKKESGLENVLDQLS